MQNRRDTRMKNKTLTGLEAIESMKQGKMVTNGHLVYKYEDGIVKCVSIMFLENNQANWCDHSVLSLNTKGYEEYAKPKPKKLTGWERVGENESYYSINGNCYVEEMTEDMCMEDKYYYEDANYFSTEEKAEEINFKQTLFRKLQRFSDENGGSEIDLKRDCHKFCIEYCSHGKLLVSNKFSSTTRDFGQVYFTSREVAQQAIFLFHDDLIKYFTTHD